MSDNGIGIKSEDIPKIFDKFSQIESSLKRNNGGVGLGLTITKQLIDSHLGAIEVVSKEAQGSTFIVYLPLVYEIKNFEMDLSHVLINHDEVGVLKIAFDEDLKIIEELKENKLLNLSKLSKELMFSCNEKKKYFVFVPKISLGSFEALVSALNDYLQKFRNSGCDIILTKVHSSKDGSDASNIMKVLIGEE